MKTARYLTLCLLLLLACSARLNAQLLLAAPGTDSRLYLGAGDKQPLLVGLGGAEGGNAWASERWRPVREQFLQKGYAFLAIGYFRAPGAPDSLDQIAVDAVHRAIRMAAQDPHIDTNRIAVIGGSRGGDLALLLGANYRDIRCVVAIVASNVVFPGHTSHFTTPAWSLHGQPLPFVPVNEKAVPALMKGALRATFEAMLTDSAAVEQAAIPVERINGPILLLSATEDEYAPSTPMAVYMTNRLQRLNFPYPVEHVPIKGRHSAPLQHFDLVTAFLDKQLRH